MTQRTTHFTYLLGAGASAKAIPVVNQLPQRILQMHEGFSTLPTRRELIHADAPNFLQDLHWLYKICKDHFSVDTYAKKLFLQNNQPELQKLKKMLSCYLKLAQGYNHLDERYDAFFASMMTQQKGKLNPLPANVNIISWNYDDQVELSLSGFLGSRKYTDIQHYLNTPDQDTPKFHYIKLNGYSGASQVLDHDEYVVPTYNDRYFEKKTNEVEFSRIKITQQSENELLSNVLALYNRLEGTEVAMRFAWEDNADIVQRRADAKRFIADTHILVIIGYSFPVFNREIDRELIGSMKDLQKIYVQIPENTIHGVTQRLRAIKDFGPQLNDERFIEKITNTDEFFIPYEFGLKANPNQIEFW